MDGRSGVGAQADFLRESVLHAFAQSRVAAVVAGIHRSSSLAQLASAKAQDDYATLLTTAHRAASSLDGTNATSTWGPPAIRPRLGWANEGATTVTVTSTPRNRSAEGKEAILATPTFLALHNPICASCGIASLPGLTSSTSRDNGPSVKRRRLHASKADQPPRRLAESKCLLCGGRVVPGQAAVDPEVEEAECHAAARSRARFPSVRAQRRTQSSAVAASTMPGTLPEPEAKMRPSAEIRLDEKTVARPASSQPEVVATHSVSKRKEPDLPTPAPSSSRATTLEERAKMLKKGKKLPPSSSSSARAPNPDPTRSAPTKTSRASALKEILAAQQRNKPPPKSDSRRGSGLADFLSML